MHANRISFSTCVVIQACCIVAMFAFYHIPFETMRRFSYANEQETILFNTLSTAPTEANDKVNNQRYNTYETSKMVPSEVDRLHKNMFLTFLKPTGRLGNQMFDFATALGIAHSLNYKFIMPASNPLLEYFELNQTLGQSLDNAEIISNDQWRQNSLNKTILSHNLTLKGLWRSWKYFDDISDKVRKSFTIKPKFLNLASTFVRSHNPHNVTLIGVHVRRGDFLREGPQQKGKVVVNKHYLRKAMKWFRRKHAGARFVVVSDDIEWCKDNIPGKDMFFSTFTEPIVDMAILSMCNHTVMSTGTFSWWGAWLAGGDVVYCSDFPRPGSLVATRLFSREDFYPPAWIGMSNGKR